VDICKDGTISYRRLGEPSFNGVALPVFSVNHEDQARQLQLRFGRLQYEEHPKMPGRPWYRWTDFPGTILALDDVSDRCDIWYRDFILKQETRMTVDEQLAKAKEALRLMLSDYRSEGCSVEGCLVCEKSRKAEEAARAVLS
jgi:hypothetical protein